MVYSWYILPSVTRSFYAGIFERRGSQRVDLHRNTNANSPTGIYRCDIATNAVHDANDISVRDTVYVGLYIYCQWRLLMCPKVLW